MILGCTDMLYFLFLECFNDFVYRMNLLGSGMSILVYASWSSEEQEAIAMTC